MKTKLKLSLIVIFICLWETNCQEVKLIENENSSIHYRVFENKSKKPIVLIINGGPGLDSEGFETVAKQIQKTNTAILYDQRGTGKSKLDSINAETITMDKMLEDIEAIRKDLKIEEWIVFGHSFGGMLASYYTSEYPDKVKALVLSSSGGISIKSLFSVNPSSKLTKVQQDSLMYWTTKINAGDTTYLAKYQRGKHLAHAYLKNKSYIGNLAHRLTQVNFTINQLMIQNMIANNFDCSERLKTYDNPVLIIHGKDDIIPVGTAEEAHKVFPNSKLVLLDNCAHYGWIDKPEHYYESVSTFLKKSDNY